MTKWLFIVCFSSSVFAQTVKEDHELLWEISGNGLKEKSYLFGSLHSNDKRLFNLSDSTYFALNAVGKIVLETDVFYIFDEWDTRQEDVKVFYDNEGNPYTSSKESTKTLYGDEDGMPQFLDAYFQQYCYNAGKKFDFLESVDYQLNIFSEIPSPKLKNISIETFLATKDNMVDLYLKGDIYALSEMLKVNLSVYPGLYQKLITDRNINMVNKLDSLLKNETLFCAVGAGHLAGGQGMINLLRSKGYKVRQVKATFSEHVTDEKSTVRQMNKYQYINDSLGLYGIFPGQPRAVESTFEDAELKLIYRDLGQGNTYTVEVFELDSLSTLEYIGEQYIASPTDSKLEKIVMDSGEEIYQGLADSYPEGLYWVRVIISDQHFAVIKAYGGNKFMNSNRPFNFFDNIWFE